jgi:hypothetical protein
MGNKNRSLKQNLETKSLQRRIGGRKVHERSSFFRYVIVIDGDIPGTIAGDVALRQEMSLCDRKCRSATGNVALRQEMSLCDKKCRSATGNVALRQEMSL